MLEYFNMDDIKDKNIVIYGIMANGSLAYKSLKKKGIEVTAFADSSLQEDFMGKPVWNVDELCSQYSKGNIIIILAVSRAREAVVKTLSEKGIDRFYDAEQLIFDEKFEKGELTESELWTYNNYREKYNYYKAWTHRDELLYLESVDLVITEKCSLRCNGCSNLMQYYVKPQQLDLNELKICFDRILQKVDFVHEAIIIGGEPLMNPEFYRVIEWYIDNPKIGSIVICTNGTIFPRENTLAYLKHRKIYIRISDYGNLSCSLDRWVDFCTVNQIAFYIVKFEVWNDCGKLEKRNYSEQMLKELYTRCSCRNLPSLIRGRLYNCSYAANAANLHAMDEKEAKRDCLDFRRQDIDYSKEDIKRFLYEREYLEACNYCSGRMWDNDYERVTEGTGMIPHQQLSKPEEYIRNIYADDCSIGN